MEERDVSWAAKVYSQLAIYSNDSNNNDNKYHELCTEGGFNGNDSNPLGTDIVLYWQCTG